MNYKLFFYLKFTSLLIFYYFLIKFISIYNKLLNQKRLLNKEFITKNQKKKLFKNNNKFFNKKMQINPNLINNKNDFEVIKNQSVCPLCKGILWEPIQCSICESCYCEKCLEKYFKGKNKICPNNCENSTFKLSKLVKNMLSILKFNCPNNCDEIIPYEQYSLHLRSKCSKEDYKSKYFELKIKLDKLKEEYKKYNPYPTESIINQTFSSKSHIHRLMFLLTPERNSWRCNVCKEIYKGSERSYYCTLCGFDLCKKCKKNE